MLSYISKCKDVRHTITASIKWQMVCTLSTRSFTGLYFTCHIVPEAHGGEGDEGEVEALQVEADLQSLVGPLHLVGHGHV